jgi:hypothetical protein
MDTDTPIEALTNDAVYEELADRLPGPYSTITLNRIDPDHLPAHWIEGAHTAARRSNNDHSHLPYHVHTDDEVFASLSVKLDFDLESTREMELPEQARVVLQGLRERQESAKDSGQPAYPGAPR